MGKAWVGIDVGKEFHWAVAVDEEGRTLLSRRVENDEGDLVRLVSEVAALGSKALWAVDMPGGIGSLALAVLFDRGQRVLYVPGMGVNRARDGYRGEGKTDARDARVIADQARMRRDLTELHPEEELLAELSLLVSHRRDLVADQTRTIGRLREALVAVFPALEATLDLSTKGALVLVSRYRTPEEVRRAGRSRIERFLSSHGVRKAAELAERAHLAASQQRLRLPGQEVAARIVSDLAAQVLALKERIARVDTELEQRFFSHPQAEILVSLPGIGPRLGAEFLVEVPDLRAFEGPDRLAAYAGLVPAPADSGKRTGNLRRMRGGNRVLKRVFYQSAFASLRTPESRAFYERKRREGKRHHQAVIALARRRVNVLWAMLRDRTTFKGAAAA